MTKLLQRGGKLLALADGLGQVHFALELFDEGRSSACIIGCALISGALELEGQPRTKSTGSSREGQFKLEDDLTTQANQSSDSFVAGVSLSIQTRKRDTLPNAQRSMNKAPPSLARVQPRSERKRCESHQKNRAKQKKELLLLDGGGRRGSTGSLSF